MHLENALPHGTLHSHEDLQGKSRGCCYTVSQVETVHLHMPSVIRILMSCNEAAPSSLCDLPRRSSPSLPSIVCVP